MERTGKIGGSDIAAVMGLSRWKTPLRLWAEKTGEVQPEDISDREYVQLGTELEDFVAKKFEQKTGMKVRRDRRDFYYRIPAGMALPADERFMAHIDRRITGSDAILECKTCSGWKAHEWEGEEIPTEYILQVMWYMGITGMHTGYIAVLIGGQKFVWKEVKWDEDLWKAMLDAAKQFMDMVEKKEPPAVVYGDKDTLSTIYPQSKKEVVLATTPQQNEELDELLEERGSHLNILKDVKAELELTENKIKAMLKEADTIQTEKYKVTWKTQVSKRVDTQKLKDAGVYDDYSKESTSRVFRTLKKKGV